MVNQIKPSLSHAIDNILDDSTEREVERVTIEVHTNIGEVKIFEFPNINAALNFLEDFTIEEMLSHADSLTLFDRTNIENN